MSATTNLNERIFTGARSILIVFCCAVSGLQSHAEITRNLDAIARSAAKDPGQTENGKPDTESNSPQTIMLTSSSNPVPGFGCIHPPATS